MYTITVSNLNDSGSGSFRSAIELANQYTGVDEIEIVFDASLAGGTLHLQSELPTISSAVPVVVGAPEGGIVITGYGLDTDSALTLNNITLPSLSVQGSGSIQGSGVVFSGSGAVLDMHRYSDLSALQASATSPDAYVNIANYVAEMRLNALGEQAGALSSYHVGAEDYWSRVTDWQIGAGVDICLKSYISVYYGAHLTLGEGASLHTVIGDEGYSMGGISIGSDSYVSATDAVINVPVNMYDGGKFAEGSSLTYLYTDEPLIVACEDASNPLAGVSLSMGEGTSIWYEFYDITDTFAGDLSVLTAEKIAPLSIDGCEAIVGCSIYDGETVTIEEDVHVSVDAYIGGGKLICKSGSVIKGRVTVSDGGIVESDNATFESISVRNASSESLKGSFIFSGEVCFSTLELAEEILDGITYSTASGEEVVLSIDEYLASGVTVINGEVLRAVPFEGFAKMIYESVYAAAGSTVIVNNLHGEDIPYVYSDSGATVIYNACTFSSDNYIGWNGGVTEFHGVDFNNSSLGLNVWSSGENSFKLTGCSGISRIQVSCYDETANVVMSGNDFSQTQFYIENLPESGSFNLSGNYWGTTDLEEIHARLGEYAGYVDLGYVLDAAPAQTLRLSVTTDAASGAGSLAEALASVANDACVVITIDESLAGKTLSLPMGYPFPGNLLIESSALVTLDAGEGEVTVFSNGTLGLSNISLKGSSINVAGTLTAVNGTLESTNPVAVAENASLALQNVEVAAVAAAAGASLSLKDCSGITSLTLDFSGDYHFEGCDFSSTAFTFTGQSNGSTIDFVNCSWGTEDVEAIFGKFGDYADYVSIDGKTYLPGGVLTVTNTNAEGEGSLAWALDRASTCYGSAVVKFDASLAGLTIENSSLPALENDVVIENIAESPVLLDFAVLETTAALTLKNMTLECVILRGSTASLQGSGNTLTGEEAISLVEYEGTISAAQWAEVFTASSASAYIGMSGEIASATLEDITSILPGGYKITDSSYIAANETLTLGEGVSVEMSSPWASLTIHGTLKVDNEQECVALRGGELQCYGEMLLTNAIVEDLTGMSLFSGKLQMTGGAISFADNGDYYYRESRISIQGESTLALADCDLNNTTVSVEEGDNEIIFKNVAGIGALDFSLDATNSYLIEDCDLSLAEFNITSEDGAGQITFRNCYWGGMDESAIMSMFGENARHIIIDGIAEKTGETVELVVTNADAEGEGSLAWALGTAATYNMWDTVDIKIAADLGGMVLPLGEMDVVKASLSITNLADAQVIIEGDGLVVANATVLNGITLPHIELQGKFASLSGSGNVLTDAEALVLNGVMGDIGKGMTSADWSATSESACIRVDSLNSCTLYDISSVFPGGYRPAYTCSIEENAVVTLGEGACLNNGSYHDLKVYGTLKASNATVADAINGGYLYIYDGAKVELTNANIVDVSYLSIGEAEVSMSGGTITSDNNIYINAGASVSLDGVTVAAPINLSGALTLNGVTAKSINIHDEASLATRDVTLTDSVPLILYNWSGSSVRDLLDAQDCSFTDENSCLGISGELTAMPQEDISDILPGGYCLAEAVSISNGNTFTVADGETLKLADGAQLTICGTMQAENTANVDTIVGNGLICVSFGGHLSLNNGNLTGLSALEVYSATLSLTDSTVSFADDAGGLQIGYSSAANLKDVTVQGAIAMESDATLTIDNVTCDTLELDSEAPSISFVDGSVLTLTADEALRLGYDFSGNVGVLLSNLNVVCTSDSAYIALPSWINDSTLTDVTDLLPGGYKVVSSSLNVSSGTTLTLGDGVVIDADGNSIYVRGALKSESPTSRSIIRGADYITVHESMELSNTSFEQLEGGIWVYSGATLSLTNCELEFVNNYNSLSVGDNSTVTMTNCTYNGRTLYLNGSGVNATLTNVSGLSSLVLSADGTFVIENCNLAESSFNFTDGTGGSVVFRNCFWNTTDESEILSRFGNFADTVTIDGCMEEWVEKISVTSSDSDGPGSLKAAIEQAAGLSGDFRAHILLDESLSGRSLTLDSDWSISTNITIESLGEAPVSITGTSLEVSADLRLENVGLCLSGDDSWVGVYEDGSLQMNGGSLETALLESAGKVEINGASLTADIVNYSSLSMTDCTSSGFISAEAGSETTLDGVSCAFMYVSDDQSVTVGEKGLTLTDQDGLYLYDFSGSTETLFANMGNFTAAPEAYIIISGETIGTATLTASQAFPLGYALDAYAGQISIPSGEILTLEQGALLDPNGSTLVVEGSLNAAFDTEATAIACPLSNSILWVSGGSINLTNASISLSGENSGVLVEFGSLSMDGGSYDADILDIYGTATISDTTVNADVYCDGALKMTDVVCSSFIDAAAGSTVFLDGVSCDSLYVSDEYSVFVGGGGLTLTGQGALFLEDFTGSVDTLVQNLGSVATVEGAYIVLCSENEGENTAIGVSDLNAYDSFPGGYVLQEGRHFTVDAGNSLTLGEACLLDLNSSTLSIDGMLVAQYAAESTAISDTTGLSDLLVNGGSLVLSNASIDLVGSSSRISLSSAGSLDMRGGKLHAGIINLDSSSAATLQGVIVEGAMLNSGDLTLDGCTFTTGGLAVMSGARLTMTGSSLSELVVQAQTTIDMTGVSGLRKLSLSMGADLTISGNDFSALESFVITDLVEGQYIELGDNNWGTQDKAEIFASLGDFAQYVTLDGSTVDNLVAGQFLVSNLNTSGEGSLAEALAQALLFEGPATIVFAESLAGAELSQENPHIAFSKEMTLVNQGESNIKLCGVSIETSANLHVEGISLDSVKLSGAVKLSGSGVELTGSGAVLTLPDLAADLSEFSAVATQKDACISVTDSYLNSSAELAPCIEGASAYRLENNLRIQRGATLSVKEGVELQLIHAENAIVVENGGNLVVEASTLMLLGEQLITTRQLVVQNGGSLVLRNASVLDEKPVLPPGSDTVDSSAVAFAGNRSFTLPESITAANGGVSVAVNLNLATLRSIFSGAAGAGRYQLLDISGARGSSVMTLGTAVDITLDADGNVSSALVATSQMYTSAIEKPYNITDLHTLDWSAVASARMIMAAGEQPATIWLELTNNDGSVLTLSQAASGMQYRGWVAQEIILGEAVDSGFVYDTFVTDAAASAILPEMQQSADSGSAMRGITAESGSSVAIENSSLTGLNSAGTLSLEGSTISDTLVLSGGTVAGSGNVFTGEGRVIQLSNAEANLSNLQATATQENAYIGVTDGYLTSSNTFNVLGEGLDTYRFENGLDVYNNANLVLGAGVVLDFLNHNGDFWIERGSSLVATGATLNLTGHSSDAGGNLSNLLVAGVVTLTDCTINGYAATSCNNDSETIRVSGNGNLTLSNCELNDVNYFDVESGGTATISNTTLQNLTNSGTVTLENASLDYLTLHGGKVSGTATLNGSGRVITLSNAEANVTELCASATQEGAYIGLTDAYLEASNTFSVLGEGLDTYRLETSLHVRNGATLTLGEGVVLESLSHGNDLIIYSGSKLEAVGAALNLLGHSQENGYSLSELKVEGVAELTNCTITAYAASNCDGYENVQVRNGGYLSMEFCQLNDVNYFEVERGGSASICNTTLQNLTSAGTLVLENSTLSKTLIYSAGSLTGAGNTFVGTGAVIVLSSAEMDLHNFAATATQEGAYIAISDTNLGGKVAYTPLGEGLDTYRLTNHLHLDRGGELTLTEGTVLESTHFSHDIAVYDGGRLVADGATIHLDGHEDESGRSLSSLIVYSGAEVELTNTTITAYDATSIYTNVYRAEGQYNVYVSAGGKLSMTNTTLENVNFIRVTNDATLDIDGVTGLTGLSIYAGAKVDIKQTDFSGASFSIIGSSYNDNKIDLSGNYWGTTNYEEILAKISGYNADYVVLENWLVTAPENAVAIEGLVGDKLLDASENSVTLRFSEAMDATTTTVDKFSIVNELGEAVEITGFELNGCDVVLEFGQLPKDGTYRVSVDNGLQSATGKSVQVYMSRNGASEYSETLRADVTPETVTAVSLQKSTQPRYVDVVFSGAVNPATAAVGLFVLRGPAGETVAVQSISTPGANTLRLNLPAFSAVGEYTLEMLPGITDYAGNAVLLPEEPLSFTLESADVSVTAADVAYTGHTYGSVQVALTANNAGNVAATAAKVEIWLTKNGSIASDSILLDIVTVDLAAGEQKELTRTLLLEQAWDLAEGEYQLVTRSSWGDELSALRADNTAAIGSLSVSYPPAADLSITAITLPESLEPGQSFALQLQVANNGGQPTPAEGLVELGLIQSGADASTMISLGTYTLVASTTGAELAPGASLLLSVPAVQLPAGIQLQGDVQLVAVINPDNDVFEKPEHRADNTCVAEQVLQLEPTLSLSLSRSEVTEGSGLRVVYTITRSGDCSEALAVQVDCALAARLGLPETLTIAAGQSSLRYQAAPVNDQEYLGNAAAEISISAAGYKGAQSSISLVEDEKPTLTLTLSAERAQEGAEITGTVTMNTISTVDTVVKLGSTYAAQLNLPESITIKAGESSASFSATVVQDETAEIDKELKITAAATGFNSGSAKVTVVDDDIPQVQLVLNKEIVSESDGYYALTATLVRTGGSDEAITVRLEDVDGIGLILPSSITLPAGTDQVQFIVGVVDDSLANAERTGRIRGTIVLDDCGCSLESTPGGTLETSLTILDNDSPSLSVKLGKNVIREGGLEQVTLTVTSNFVNEQDVVITLSELRGILNLPETLVLAAGQTSVSCVVTAKGDGETSGSHLANISATAEGYGAGIGYLQVSDIDLPDLVVESVQLTGAAIAGQETTFSVVVHNQGYAATQQGASVKLVLSDGTVLGTVEVPAGLAAGQRSTMTLDAKLPSITASVSVRAEVDADNRVVELDNSNNYAASPSFTIESGYTVTASVNQSVLMGPGTVQISGSIQAGSTGLPVANQKVNVYVFCKRGLLKQIAVKTDENGNFSTQYDAPKGADGQFTVRAGVFSEMSDTLASFAMAELSVVTSNSDRQWYIKNGETLTGSITIRNTGAVDLHGVTLVAGGLPENIRFQLDSSAIDLAAGQSATFQYSITGTGLSAGSLYSPISFRAESAENVGIDFTGYSYVATPKASLKLDVRELNLSVSTSGERFVEVVVTNEGAGETGKVTLSLPDVPWLQAYSGSTIENIKPGGSATVVLKLTPQGDEIINAPYNGRLAINAENADGVRLPYEVTFTESGCASIDLCLLDSSSVVTGQQKILEKVFVQLQNAYTQELAASGYTDAFGKICFEEVVPGTYYLVSSLDGYQTSRKLVTLHAGDSFGGNMYLEYNAVTYSFELERTEIEDQYVVTQTATYNTQVPRPVIVASGNLSAGSLAPGEQTILTLVMSNYGKVAATGFTVELPSAEGYTLETMGDVPAVIAAESSVTIPILVTRDSGAEKGAFNVEDCLTKTGVYAYFDLCISKDNKLVGGSFGITIGVCGYDLGDLGEWLGRPSGRDLTEVEITTHLPDNDVTSLDPNAQPKPFDAESVINRPTFKVALQEPCDPCLSAFWNNSLSCGAALLLPNGTLDIVGDFATCAFAAKNIYDACGTLWPFKANVQEESKLTKLITEYHNRLTRYWLFRMGSLEVDLRFIDLEKAINCTGIQKWVDELSLYISGSSIEERMISDSERKILLDGDFAQSWSAPEELEQMMERWNRTLDFNARGIYSVSDVPQGENTDFYSTEYIEDWQNAVSAIEQESKDAGYGDLVDYVNAANKALMEYVESENSVCAAVTLSFTQTAAMTREAFIGTFTMNNTSTSDLRDIQFSVKVTDAQGVDVSEHFNITYYGFDKITGVVDATLSAGTEGKLYIQFIPDKTIAADGAANYYFGGNLSYYSPDAGRTIEAELTPIIMAVNPSPDLTLHYFLTESVYSDDLFTDYVESAQRAEIGLIVQNTGLGTAKNFTLTDFHPEFLSNEQGLALELKMLGSSLNGGDLQASGTTLNFGSIEGESTSTAIWYFQTNMQGVFSNYESTFTRVDQFGDEVVVTNGTDVSLISATETHMLTRSMNADGDEKTDFLVNDEDDGQGLADGIYFGDGSYADVHAVTGIYSTTGQLGGGVNTITLTMYAVEGWNYYRINDPGEGNYRIESISVGGVELDPSMVWQTDRVFTEKGAATYVNHLHWVAESSADGYVDFSITYSSVDEKAPEVTSISGVEDKTTIKDAPAGITVTFSEAVAQDTFTVDCIDLKWQGNKVDLTGLEWVWEDAQTLRFTNLQNYVLDDGLYALQVLNTGLQDAFGNAGVGEGSGAALRWTMAASTLAIESVSGYAERKLNKRVGSLLVSFNESVSSFTTDAITLVHTSLNGVQTVISDLSGLTINQLDHDGKVYEISGLNNLQSAGDGTYSLQINSELVQDADGNMGTGATPAEWNLHETPPSVLAHEFKEEEQTMNEIDTVTLQFSHAVGNINANALIVKCNGEVYTGRGFTCEVDPSDPTRVIVRGISKAVPSGKAAAMADGHWQLSLDMSGVEDIYGNVGSGTYEAGWNVDTVAPESLSGITINGGSSMIVSSPTITIATTLPESGLYVELYESSVESTGKGTLLWSGTVEGTELNRTVTLQNGGRREISVVTTDSAGNYTTNTYAVLVDVVVVAVSMELEPEFMTLPETVKLTFNAEVEGFAVDAISLTAAGKSYDMTGTKLTQTSATEWELSGLGGLNLPAGDYSLSVDLSTVSKTSSGLQGQGVYTQSFTYDPVAEVRVAGCDITTGAGSVTGISISFSTNINYAELKKAGVLGDAVRLVNQTTGSVVELAADGFAYAGNTLTWSGEQKLPGGSYALVIDPALLTAANGSPLVGNEGTADTAIVSYVGDAVLLGAAGSSYSAPYAVDWNADGHTDLLVGEKVGSEGKVRLYLNDGNGRFADYTYLRSNGADLSVTASGCQGIVVALQDITGDGIADLVAGLSNGAVQYFSGMADGSFGTAAELLGSSVAGSRAYPTFHDWNADGVTDLVLGTGSGSLMVGLGSRDAATGALSFATPTTIAGIEVPGRAAPVFADVNGDTVDDLILGAGDGSLTLYYGTESGYHKVASWQLDGISWERSRVTLADLNADGTSDLVVGGSTGAVYVVYGAAASGTWSEAFEVVSGAVISSTAAAVEGKNATLSWVVDYAETGLTYIVEVADNADFANATSQEVNATTLTMNGLADGNFFWRVSIKDSAKPAVTGQSFTVDTVAPGAPAELAATVNNGTVLFSWAAVTDASGVKYELRFSSAADFAGATVVASNEAGLNLSLPAGEWYWQVRAVDGAGNAGAWATAAESLCVDEYVIPEPTADRHWAQGLVTSGATLLSGYWDADKSGTGDRQLCWAAADANMLAWWQQQYGVTDFSSSDVPESADDIFAVFKQNWANVSGREEFGLTWWISGASENGSYGTFYADNYTGSGEQGAYYAAHYDAAATSALVKEVSLTGADAEQLARDWAAVYAAGGIISLGVYSSLSGSTLVGGHALTVWGFATDSAGRLSSITVTDSDDGVDAAVTLSLAYNVTKGYYQIAQSGTPLNGRLLGDYTSLAAFDKQDAENNTATGAEIITMSEPENGSSTSTSSHYNWVGSGDEQDFFAFSAPGVGIYRVNVNTRELDSDLLISVGSLDSDGDFVVEKQARIKPDSSISGISGLRLDSGEQQYIRISSVGGEATSYELTVRGDIDEASPITDNNVKTKATKVVGTIQEDATISSWVGSGDALDLYYFELTEECNFSLSLGGLDKNAKVKLLYDNGDGTYGSIISSTVRASRGLEFNDALAAGTYYLEIASYDNGSGRYNTAYTLEMEKEIDGATTRLSLESDSPLTDNNTKETATELELVSVSDAVITSWVGAGDALDYYRFEISQSGTLGLCLSELEKNTTVRLYQTTDDGYKQLMNNTVRASRGLDTELSLTTGTYYLEIASYDNGAGRYNTTYALELEKEEDGEIKRYAIAGEGLA